MLSGKCLVVVEEKDLFIQFVIHIHLSETAFFPAVYQTMSLQCSQIGIIFINLAFQSSDHLQYPLKRRSLI